MASLRAPSIWQELRRYFRDPEHRDKLAAKKKAGMAMVLVGNKCDVPLSERQVLDGGRAGPGRGGEGRVRTAVIDDLLPRTVGHLVQMRPTLSPFLPQIFLVWSTNNFRRLSRALCATRWGCSSIYSSTGVSAFRLASSISATAC